MHADALQGQGLQGIAKRETCRVHQGAQRRLRGRSGANGETEGPKGRKPGTTQ